MHFSIFGEYFKIFGDGAPESPKVDRIIGHLYQQFEPPYINRFSKINIPKESLFYVDLNKINELSIFISLRASVNYVRATLKICAEIRNYFQKYIL